MKYYDKRFQKDSIDIQKMYQTRIEPKCVKQKVKMLLLFSYFTGMRLVVPDIEIINSTFLTCYQFV